MLCDDPQRFGQLHTVRPNERRTLPTLPALASNAAA
jgi:hypothetical protein